MTQEGGEPAGRGERSLDGLLGEGNAYYEFLKRKHNDQTRLHVALASVVVWFAAFDVLGLGALTTTHRPGLEDPAAAFLVAVAFGAAAGLVMYASRRKRGLGLDELGSTIEKMRQAGALSSESGIRLTDAMHRAGLQVRKRGMDSAYEYGVVAFVAVFLVGLGPIVAALAGVAAYLYFRHEAREEYQDEEEKYENSKRELLQSL